MDVIRDLDALPAEACPTVMTIGNFDGVHRGHQALIATVRARARSVGGRALAVTFDPHPQSLLHPDSAPIPITSMAEKLELLAAAGLDRLVIIPFTAEFARTEAEDFVEDYLLARFHASEIYVGSNFGFGRGKRGHFALLAAMAETRGFHASIVDAVTDAGEVISSTRIRSLLAKADLAAASSELTRPYQLWGAVVKGDGRGRTIGFPTANVEGDKPCLLPHGVYAARVSVRGATHSGALNYGTRPTFRGDTARVEVHILDFPPHAPDLYGEPIRVQFVQKLRDERRFGSPSELAAQIARDVAAARGALAREGDHHASEV